MPQVFDKISLEICSESPIVLRLIMYLGIFVLQIIFSFHFEIQYEGNHLQFTEFEKLNLLKSYCYLKFGVVKT